MNTTDTPETDKAEFDRDEDCSIPDNMVVASEVCRRIESRLRKALEELLHDAKHTTASGAAIAREALASGKEALDKRKGTE